MMYFISVYFFLILELAKCDSTHYTITNVRSSLNSDRNNINNNNNINRSIWTRFKLVTGPNFTPKITQTGRLHEAAGSVYKVIQNKDNKTEVKFITLNPNSTLLIHSKHYNSSINISGSGRETNSERRRVPMGSVQLTTKLVNATNKINVNKDITLQQSKIGVSDHLLAVSEIGRRRRRPPIIRDQQVEEEDDEDEDDDDDDYGISEVTETVEEDLEDDDDDDDDDEEEEENEEIVEVPVDEVSHKIPHQPQYAVIPQPVYVQQSTRPVHSTATAVAIPKRTRKHKLGRGKHKIKKRLKKFMLPLLLAYKLKFLILVPLLMGALVLIVGTTGFAGFFFALFVVGLGLQKKWS